MGKIKAPRNRTIELTEEEIKYYLGKTIKLDRAVSPEEIKNKTINQDLFNTLAYLPPQFVDLLIIDPPYNLTKKFGTIWFMEKSDREYEEWAESWFASLIQTLKLNASVYLCCDWRCSSIFEKIAKKYLYVQNRITWEREKGRGAKTNWKNCSEDIWFFTMQANGYLFNVEDVKLKRKVLAPYTNHNGEPKDWDKTEKGNFRTTYPSNIWTDISVPFWSMPENTNHPTQKPEKLIAKLILASSNPGNIILDPFVGSGTTSVVAKKLGRSYVGIEIDEMNCCLTEKRLELVQESAKIQGYEDGVFWERNTKP